MMWVLMLLLALICLLWWLVLWKRESRVLGSALPSRLMLIGLLLPLLGAGLYLGMGYDPETPSWLRDRAALSDIADELIAGEAPDNLGEVSPGSLARVLQGRLHRNPSAAGWYALGLLYSEMEVAALAAESARRAVALDGERIEPRMLLAQSLVEEADGRLTNEAREVLESVLEMRADHDGAWMLLGMSAANVGDYDLAIRAWESLISRHGESEVGPLLQRSLRFARDQQAARERFAGQGARVEAEGIRPGGTLFVSLRRVGQAGQPLAARRILAERFPIEVSLRPQDWLQPYPQGDVELEMTARYSPSAAMGVEGAEIRSQPETVEAGSFVTLKLLAE